MSSYSSSTYDCLSDNPVCFCVYFCTPCAICNIAKKIGAEDTHGCMEVVKAVCATEFWICAICCCPESIFPCFLTSLYKKSMEKHGITEPLGPCGKSECCGCYWQMCLPCSAACTLCVICREAKKI
eukprot:gene8083-16582_t